MENMFGDILTDEASVLAGSIGLLPSASLGARESNANGAAQGSLRADPRQRSSDGGSGSGQSDRDDSVVRAPAQPVSWSICRIDSPSKQRLSTRSAKVFALQISQRRPVVQSEPESSAKRLRVGSCGTRNPVNPSDRRKSDRQQQLKPDRRRRVVRIPPVSGESEESLARAIRHSESLPSQ